MMPGAILVVEDEPLIRMFVADILEDAGFQVAEAECAAAAVAKLHEASAAFSAVIIDVGLPDRSGDLLANDTRSQFPDLPIVIASGRDRIELARRFGHDSRTTVLGKPYTSHMLIDALRGLGVESRSDA